MDYPTQALRVAVCQMTSTDDINANLAQIFKMLDDIEDPTLVDLITFPENALFFRVNKSSGLKTLDLNDQVFADLQKYCERHQTEILLGSVPLAEELGVVNATVHLKPGHMAQAVYRKIHLFDVDVKGAPPVRESDLFRHGTEPKVLEVKGWRLGMSICYDLRFAELYSIYASKGVHGIFIPSAFLVPTGEAHWHILMRARAIESQAYVIAPAQFGEHRSLTGDSRYTYGHSLVVSPWGEVVGEATNLQQVLVVDLDPNKLRQVHQQIPMNQHRRL